MKTRLIFRMVLPLALACNAVAPALGQDVIRTYQPDPDAVVVPPPATTGRPDAEPAHQLPARQNPSVRMNLPLRFEPDPQRVRLSGETTIPAETLAPQCRGHVSEQPQLMLTYIESGLPLFFDASGSGVTLVVETPSGDIQCTRQRTGTTGAALTVHPALTGSYRVWLSSRRPDSRVTANLSISERGQAGPLAMHPPVPSRDISLGDGVRPDDSPAQGIADIWLTQAGPSRWPVVITAREAISLRGQTACEGFIDGRPTLGVTASIGQAVTLYTEGLVDTVIFARAPDGNWVCNDDSGVGYNAGLTLDLSGGEVWTVFVGTYSQHAGYPETTLVLQAASLTSPIGEK